MNTSSSHSHVQSAPSPPVGSLPLPSERPDSDRTAISYLFWIAGLSGLCGLHRLYNGRIVTGLLWMFTLGLCGVGQLVDLALIPGMAEQRSRQLKKRKYQLGQFDSPAVVVNSDTRAQPLMIQLLQLAKRNKGRLLVTDCVLETGATFAEVELQLTDLVKSGYAHITNDTNSGVVVYEIPELESV